MKVNSPEKLQFIDVFDYMQKNVYEYSKEKGWWDLPEWFLNIKHDLKEVYLPSVYANIKKSVRHNKGEKIALMHSELSECLEGIRNGNPPDDKIPEFTSEEAELADVIIRIMDYAGHYDLRIAEAIIAKHDFNLTRPYKHGGKSF